MPSVKGKAACKKKNFSKNVAAEVRSGKPVKQSVAIAHSYCKRGKKGK
jgi:hypothetical protein